jgi:hypothetical protein
VSVGHIQIPPEALNGALQVIQYVVLEHCEQLLIALLQTIQTLELSKEVVLQPQRLLELSERNKVESQVKHTDPLQVKQFPKGVEQGMQYPFELL